MQVFGAKKWTGGRPSFHQARPKGRIEVLLGATALRILQIDNSYSYRYIPPANVSEISNLASRALRDKAIWESRVRPAIEYEDHRDYMAEYPREELRRPSIRRLLSNTRMYRESTKASTQTSQPLTDSTLTQFEESSNSKNGKSATKDGPSNAGQSPPRSNLLLGSKNCPKSILSTSLKQRPAWTSLYKDQLGSPAKFFSCLVNPNVSVKGERSSLAQKSFRDVSNGHSVQGRPLLTAVTTVPYSLKAAYNTPEKASLRKCSNCRSLPPGLFSFTGKRAEAATSFSVYQVDSGGKDFQQSCYLIHGPGPAKRAVLGASTKGRGL